MKKAKIMLSAIAVIAIVGGAVAFKAQKLPTVTYTICGSSDICVTTTGSNVDFSKQGLIIPNATTNAVAGQVCAGNCDSDLQYNVEL